MQGYSNPDALIETSFLSDNLDDASIAIVEVDEDTTAFDKGHIPGAVAIDWERELRAAPRRDFISREGLSQLLGSKGISSEQAIVLYGGNNNWFAAYAYWLCRYRGIDNVKLLNGGRMKWELEGRPMTTETANRPAASFSTNDDKPELRVFRNDVVALAEGGGGTLIDVRSPAEFTGEVMAPPHLPQEQPYVAGHVPNAKNIPWSQAANEDGTFRSADELRALYEGAGVRPNGQIIAYCRIGERSSHTWFVLHELLGYPSVSNYDGSWTEYGSLVDVPVETGSGS
jgi:thiosulfate/3-mercaptopyruvate sulfurtransferase